MHVHSGGDVLHFSLFCITLERAGLSGLGHQYEKQQSLSLWLERNTQNYIFFLGFVMTPGMSLSSQQQWFICFRAEVCMCSLVPLATLFLVGHVPQCGIFLWSMQKSCLVCVLRPALHASSQLAAQLCASLGNVLAVISACCISNAPWLLLTLTQFKANTLYQHSPGDFCFQKSIRTTCNLQILFQTVDRAVKIRVVVWCLLNNQWLKISANIPRLLLILSKVADTLY